MHAAWAAVALVVAVSAGGHADSVSRASPRASERGSSDADGERVLLRAVPVGDYVPAPTVDDLDDGDVLVLSVDEGVPDARGSVQQCARWSDGFTFCSNTFPVLFDEEGRANFQYQLDDRDGCGAAGACAVVVRDEEREREAAVFIVFGEEIGPPPAAVLTPPGPYDGGESVTIDVRPLIPGTRLGASFCDQRCGDVRRTVAGDDGTATLTLEIGERCDQCRIVVIGGGRSVSLPVSFAAPPTAVYETRRVIAGLTAATVFLLLAWRLVAATDWRPPSEARTPELELADIT